MSHYTFTFKDAPVPLITDGKWHPLELSNGVFSVAPPEPGRYLLQYQLNGQQGEHAAGKLVKDADKNPVGLLGSVIELQVARYPTATSQDGATAGSYIETARRRPLDFWAGTGHADIEINPPGSGDSEQMGINYKVAGGEGVSLDRILKFTRQWDIR